MERLYRRRRHLLRLRDWRRDMMTMIGITIGTTITDTIDRLGDVLVTAKGARRWLARPFF
jgi:hypothetical protein